MCIRGVFRILPNIQQLYNLLKISGNKKLFSYLLVTQTAPSSMFHRALNTTLYVKRLNLKPPKWKCQLLQRLEVTKNYKKQLFWYVIALSISGVKQVHLFDLQGSYIEIITWLHKGLVLSGYNYCRNLSWKSSFSCVVNLFSILHDGAETVGVLLHALYELPYPTEFRGM